MASAHTARIIREGLRFGEAPRWHEGRLWFSDFYRHGVFSMAFDGTDERLELTVPGQPSGIGWMPDGSMLVVSMTDHTVLRWSPGTEPTPHASLEAFCGYWANDLVVSTDGTAYVGNFGFDLDTFLETHGVEGVLTPPGPPTTNLVVLAPDGSVLQVVPDMAFPNGMVLDPSGTALIVAETMAMRLTRFDVAADGTLSNRRSFADLELVAADGICLDAEGQVWVANALAPEAVRIAEGGAVTARVSTSQTCFACMLGGEGRLSLYLMTAPTSTARRAASALDGRIEVAEVPVGGAGRP